MLEAAFVRNICDYLLITLFWRIDCLDFPRSTRNLEYDANMVRIIKAERSKKKRTLGQTLAQLREHINEKND